MLFEVIVGGGLGCVIFVGFLKSQYMPILCGILYVFYAFFVIYNGFIGFIFNCFVVYMLLFCLSLIVYHPHGKPASIWSSIYMRDDEWEYIENLSLFECFKSSIFGINGSIMDSNNNNNNRSTHMYCLMFYVSSLPEKEHLIDGIESIINKYPQLCNIPVIGESIVQSSFSNIHNIFIDKHIYSYRLKSNELENIDELICNKIPMNLYQPWWDIFLITPEIENNELALDPLHAMRSLIIFRFHQSIIDLPTIKSFFHELSNHFAMQLNIDQTIIDDGLFKMSGVIKKNYSNIITNNNNNDDDSGFIKDEIKESIPDNNSIKYYIYQSKIKFKKVLLWINASITVIKIFFKSYNVFNNYYIINSPTNVVTKSIEDTPLKQMIKASDSDIIALLRTCVSGAIMRYCKDSNTNNNISPKKSRILEDFDLSRNTTILNIDNESNTNLPLFNEMIGLTSLKLFISDEYSHSRQRLNAIPDPININKQYRIAFIIHKIFVGLFYFLPDLLAKKIVSYFIKNHSLELICFNFNKDLYIGNDIIEDIRLFKTNINLPVLSLTLYNERISIDLSFTQSNVKDPSLLVSGFLAEMEELQYMLKRK